MNKVVITLEEMDLMELQEILLDEDAAAALVFLLSLRLREREIETIVKIGGSPARVAAIPVSEIVVVLVLGAAFAGVLAVLASRYGSEAIRMWITS